MRKKFLSERKKLLSYERGTFFKKKFKLRIALGFPNSYELGMSNLGFLTIYKLLNQIDEVFCERFFLFDKKESGEVKTMESNLPLSHFSIIAFSVAYELDYLNILKILKLSGIPLKSEQRDKRSPLVVAGGVAVSLNPETVADFFDCLFIGESEDLILEFISEYLRLSKKKTSKERMFFCFSQIPGIYVPGFYKPEYDQRGWVTDIKAEGGVPQTIKKRKVELGSIQTHSPIITPFSHFQKSFLVEVGRGCSRGCRFCAAGFLYRPTRFHTQDNLLNQIRSYAQNTKRIGLVGSLVSDFPRLEELCSQIYEKGLEIQISSFRVDKVKRELLQILVRSGIKTLTIAPEVGSDKMWRVINKKISREDVLRSVEIAKDMGVRKLKLYFIVGLPWENQEDIQAILELVSDIHKIYRKFGRITLSVNPFIPKPNTPFQWAGMNPELKLKEKLQTILNKVKTLPGVSFEKKSIREATFQGILSLGNRRVGEALYYRTVEGLNFNKLWKKVGVDFDFFVLENKNLSLFFPWDMIDTGIKKEFLKGEYRRAEKEANINKLKI
ncbi:MAG: hypothetical protein AMJ90_02100 [candidate division Zixibacteria bacterium SM23_73_2]|nr:MAG: hypothetical protein AMJ90_02100 [candidate division Zixibacteria bacterium SM23_73_2]